MPDGIGPPVAPYSPVVISGELVFLSGQIPYDADNQLVEGGIELQTHQVLTNMEKCLEAAGCSFEDVVKVNSFLSDFADFPGFNAVYEQYFKAPLPTRTTVQVGLHGFRVEVEAIARRPSADSTDPERAQ
jgi:2-iminobutanoate/2-iminopropanoate deaminase